MQSPRIAIERIMAHHDYVWARLPFLGPMAIAVARRRPTAAGIASRIISLGHLVLDHLELEERVLDLDGAAAATKWLGDGMLRDHHVIAARFDDLRSVVAGWELGADVVELDRRFALELVLLGDHLMAQIKLEEELVMQRLDDAHHG